MTDMNDQEKSVLLAKAMGWTIEAPEYFDLYRPKDMALAWRVLNWAAVTMPQESYYLVPLQGIVLDTEKLPPPDAQRLWLDKILKLAIEAGLIEVQDD